MLDQKKKKNEHKTKQKLFSSLVKLEIVQLQTLFNDSVDTLDERINLIKRLSSEHTAHSHTTIIEC